MRVPTIFWWPGKIKPAVVTDMGTTMDLMPTFCALSGTKLPDDRVYDGYDMTPLLMGTGEGVRETVFYYHGKQVYAIRKGDFIRPISSPVGIWQPNSPSGYQSSGYLGK
jgi:arylsulfatase A